MPLRLFLFALLAATGLAQSPLLWEIADGPLPNVPHSSIGKSVVLIDDLDGDGLPDLAIGNPRVEVAPSGLDGRIELRSSRDQSLLGTIPNPGVLLNGQPIFSGFGANIAVFPDLDGDGVRDLHVSTLAAASAGIFSTMTGVELDVPHCAWNPAIGYWVQSHIEPVDDINGDSVPEYAAIHFGSCDPADADPPGLRIHDGSTGASLSYFPQADGFPTRVESIDDIDGDGLRDLVWLRQGSPGFCPFTGNAIEVISSATGASLLALDGDVTLLSQAMTRDINGDGFEDLVLANHGPNVEAWSFHPTTTQLLDWPHGYSGVIRPLTAGDVDGDGTEEIVFVWNQQNISFIDLPSSGFPVTAPYVGTVGTNLLQHLAAYWFEDVVSPGDLNGDGLDDIVAGAGAVDFQTVGGVLAYNPAGPRPYGAPSGPGPILELNWGSYGGPSGFVAIESATPVGTGLILASLAPASQSILGLEILVETSPFLGFSASSIGFDASGRWTFNANLAQPFLAGTSIYLQAVDTSFSPRVSPGLQLRFLP